LKVTKTAHGENGYITLFIGVIETSSSSFSAFLTLSSNFYYFLPNFSRSLAENFKNAEIELLPGSTTLIKKVI
jgi:hypothetical protein